MKKIILVLILLAIPFVSAIVTLHGSNIERNYQGGDLIRGNVNVSFRNVPYDSIVTSNMDGASSLGLWLERNNLRNNVGFNCSTENCLPRLQAEEETGSFDGGNSSYLGLKIEGSLIGIDLINFTLNGFGGASCQQNLALSFAGKSELTIGSSNYVNEVCDQENYGCFSPSGTNNAEIPYDGQYCEKIRLGPAPAYKVGARITNTTSSVSNLMMKLYLEDGAFIGECTLPALSMSTETIGCNIGVASITSRDYFVCIKAQSNSRYTIRTETSNPCGTVNFGESYPVDYEIFAQRLKYGPPKIEVSEERFFSATGTGLKEAAEEYISTNYEGRCNPYCIIPFKINSGSQSFVTDPLVIYDIDGASNLRSETTYRVSEQKSLVNSGQLNLDISKLGLRVPLGSEAKTFSLFVDGQKILNQSITVSPSFNFSVGPTIVRVGQNTEFSIASSRNVTSSSWDFGDGSILNVEGKKSSHRYTQIGSFNLTVEAKDSSGVSGRSTVTVEVGDAKQSANLTIQDYRKRIKEIDSDLGVYPEYVQDKIKKELDLVGALGVVESSAREYDSAENDDEYVAIINQINDLNLPKSIETVFSGTLPIAIGLTGANLIAIEQLTGKEIPNREAFLENLAFWTNENLKGEIRYEIAYGEFDNSYEAIFSVVKVEPRFSGSEESYLILGYEPSAIVTSGNYQERSIDSGIAFKVERDATYEIMILDEVDPSSLGIAVVPVEIGSLLTEEELPICKVDRFCDELAGEDEYTCPRDCKSYIGTYSTIALVLLGLFAIAFGAIWWWYKLKYEKSIFPNRADLFNITGFIRTQRRNKVQDRDIREKLKKAGWNGEQINYAMKKVGRESIPVKK